MARIEITRNGFTQKSKGNTMRLFLLRSIVRQETGREPREIRGYRLQQDHPDLGGFRAGDEITVAMK